MKTFTIIAAHREPLRFTWSGSEADAIDLMSAIGCRFRLLFDWNRKDDGTCECQVTLAPELVAMTYETEEGER